MTELQGIYQHAGPFATAYLDASRDTESGAHEVELRWRELRSQLSAAGAPDELLDRMGEVAESNRAPGKHGLVMVGSSDSDPAVLFTADMPAPPTRAEATYTPLPHLMPYVAQLATRPQYLLAVADRTGADIEIHSARGQMLSESVDGTAGHPVHETGRDDWSERHFQNRVHNAWEQNARDVADEISTLAAKIRPDIIVLAGDARARSLLSEQLGTLSSGAPVVEVEAGGRADGASEQELQDAVRDAVLHRVWAQRREVLERLAQDVGRGEYGVTGLADVMAALRDARVDTLVVSDDPDSSARAWCGPDTSQVGLQRDDVAALGVDDPQEDRFDAVALRAAICTGARVIATPGGHHYMADGVGAILRY